VDVDVSYVILFPFEKDDRVNELSFEIEQVHKNGNENGGDDGVGDHEGARPRERFRTVGLAAIPHDAPEELESCYATGTATEHELRHKLQMASLEDGNYDVVTSFELDGVEEQFTQRASTCVMASACAGNLDDLKRYLAGSPNPESLLRIADSEGQSLLALAVSNGHRKVVEYLLERGSDINVSDAKGRTPLMEAAFWSQPKLVEILLKAGSDRFLKDRRGMTAADLAAESDRNDLERHERALNYSEDPYVKKRHRRLIRALLGHKPAKHPSAAISRLSEDLIDAYFYKSRPAGTISLVIPKFGIEIHTQAKTAAVLLRGSAFPPVAAVSGWTGPATEEFLSPEAGFERLNEGHWASEALAVAVDIDFAFERHAYDKCGVPGSYNACHAESQLMCFFLRRNYIFRNYDDRQEVHDDFLQLFLLQEKNRRAQIIVSNDPCESCRALRDCILERLGIEFVFDELEVKSSK
jgi:hypothetical protein